MRETYKGPRERFVNREQMKTPLVFSLDLKWRDYFRGW
jgi:hypothetical protein